MIYTGQFLIIFSLLNNFISLLIFFYNLKTKSLLIEKIFLFLTRLNTLLIFLAFLFLMYLYIISDFRNINVFFNSHIDKPLIYKISGVWGNHEGSLLLWILIMSIYTFVFSFNRSLDNKTKNLTIFFQTTMILGFLVFMLLTSNPFIVNLSNISQGMGLNPILQDPALAIHPPLLYFGYVGYSLILSFALAGLINNKIEISWIKTAKKYSMFCWLMLTFGITAGSYWAYYELGWGGWWFWDPVENASLMPWLAGIALVHSLQIANNNTQIKKWVIFLSILCFSLSLFGTFLVRSGVLMSVHAFANDSYRGIFILIIFFIVTGFSFLIFLIKTNTIEKEPSVLVFNKFTALIINNIVMTIACFTVMLGTIYPILLETVTNERITVGAPYFNSTVVPIVLPGLLLMAIAPTLAWKNNKLNEKKSYLTIFLLIIFLLLATYMFSDQNLWGLIGISVGIWIIIASIIQLFKKNAKKQIRLYGGLISHIGVGILILGITISSIWQKEFIVNIEVGEEIIVNNYKLKFENLKESKDQNYVSLKSKFIISNKTNKIGEIEAEKRYYPVSKTVTTEAGILHQIQRDIYVVLGENLNNEWLIKVYFNPFISFIWIGAFIMAIGGFISLGRK